MLDLKTSLRGLTRAPLIAAAALLTVTLTLGGTVAVFTLLDAVVLRSLPYRDGDRLVAVWTDVTELTEEVRIQDPLREWTNLDSHRDVRAMSSSLDDLAAFSGWAPAFRADDGMQRIPGAMVTWNGLQVLGVTPVAGRLFTETEGEAASGCSVVIVERFWHRHLAGDAAVIGQEIFLTDDSCTVVGVLPDGFRFPFLPSTEIVRSITATGNDRGAAYLRQFGRLASGGRSSRRASSSTRSQRPCARSTRWFAASGCS